MYSTALDSAYHCIKLFDSISFFLNIFLKEHSRDPNPYFLFIPKDKFITCISLWFFFFFERRISLQNSRSCESLVYYLNLDICEFDSHSKTFLCPFPYHPLSLRIHLQPRILCQNYSSSIIFMEFLDSHGRLHNKSHLLEPKQVIDFADKNN